jgi:hypothetical protein
MRSGVGDRVVACARVVKARVQPMLGPNFLRDEDKPDNSKVNLATAQ